MCSLSMYDIIDNGASYCLEGESPSIITAGNSCSLSSSAIILCLFGEICCEVILLFNKNLSYVCCFCQCFNVFMKWAITLSLNMFTVLFVITVSG